jgi:hypothetical protein
MNGVILLIEDKRTSQLWNCDMIFAILKHSSHLGKFSDFSGNFENAMNFGWASLSG